MIRTKWLLVGLGLSLTLGACTSSGKHAASATSSTTTSASSAGTGATSTAPSTSAATSSTTPTTSPGATLVPAVSTTSNTGTGSDRCAAGSLSGALTNENGAAGSVYYTLRFTNRGSTSCVLQGWPGVSFMSSPTGPQVGAPATRIPGSSPALTLAPGASAGAALQITEPTNYGTGCRVTPVTGLRVYPPDQTVSLYVAHSDHACANTTDVTLHVGAFQASS